MEEPADHHAAAACQGAEAVVRMAGPKRRPPAGYLAPAPAAPLALNQLSHTLSVDFSDVSLPDSHLLSL